MTWAERLVLFMREDRANILSQIELFSTGRCRVLDSSNGEKDITGEALTKLHRQLAEIEDILSEAGVTFDA